MRVLRYSACSPNLRRACVDKLFDNLAHSEMRGRPRAAARRIPGRKIHQNGLRHNRGASPADQSQTLRHLRGATSKLDYKQLLLLLIRQDKVLEPRVKNTS